MQDPATPDATAPRPLMPPLPAANKTPWSTIIGIIAIVFGGGGILTGLMGMLAPLFNQLFIEFMPADQTAMYQTQARYQWWGVGLSVAAMLVAVLLLVGGIGLLKRRPAAVSRLKTWAVAKIVLTLAMATFQGVMQAGMWESMQQQAQQQTQQPGAALPEVFSNLMIAMTVAFTLAWGLALPVFMLIWFGRKKVTAEVRSWDDEPGRDALEV